MRAIYSLILSGWYIYKLSKTDCQTSQIIDTSYIIIAGV